MTFRQLIFFVILLLLGCNSGAQQNEPNAYTNDLIHENSPYLLQHAHNPVHWQPWGEKALAQAKAENKLLLISIGYAACHWCHVMEHESFEDTIVANLMNKHFVCIKVDREERPDVDNVYMTACQLVKNSSCGWPLNAFALPDGRPVWAGTYFPKKNWLEILEYFQNEWEKTPDGMNEFAEQVAQGLAVSDRVPGASPDASFSEKTMNSITRQFLQGFDFKKGGRLGAPKFPMPNNYLFLLENYHFNGNEKELKAVTATLDGMANGGIFDQLGGGFARYSTDNDWLVPHFEKMLYDNAQLVSLYSQAFQVTKNLEYQRIVEQTLDFVERELTAPDGAFYSSLDADSDGEEGRFYVWEKKEIQAALADEKMAAAFCDFYEVSEKGNWEDSKNILHRKRPAADIAKRQNMSEAELEDLISKAKAKLFAVRSKRVRPTLDDKSLTAWNGLMVKGYVDAYRAIENQKWLSAALRNGQLTLDKIMQPDHSLRRNYKDGKAVINAFLDDYAITAEAFTALYQVTFDEKWLNAARDLTDYAFEHFYDEKTGFFFYTSDLDPPLVARKIETEDNVIPASNSLMANNLYVLGEYFYDEKYRKTAQQMMQKMADPMRKTDSPDYYSNWGRLYLQYIRPVYEVAIVGEDFAKKRDDLMRHYLPNALLMGGRTEGTLELLKDKLQAGETMIYVCQNKVCKLPVQEVDAALDLMRQ
ncbi:MAG: DUF255 domain-containing protein [Bacteroidetes bacterium]|nr:DUF255 domain-containing protein [Bacteroidota bacterium]